MKLGIIDVREWQTTVNLETGYHVEVTPTPLTREISKLLSNNPFPGDLRWESNSWVSTVALQLDHIYQPELMFLSYATTFFQSMFAPREQIAWEKLVSNVKDEVERFINTSGFTPVIVGTGSTTALAGNIDLTQLDGLAISGGMGPLYAGLYDPSSRDLEYLQNNQLIATVIPRSQMEKDWPGNSSFHNHLPDYLLIARPGYVFRGLGSMSRIVHRVSSQDPTIPVKADATVHNITDIAGLVRKMLKNNKVALILLEGIGIKDFPWKYSECSNTYGTYTYNGPDEQYHCICTGLHLPGHPYPPGYRYYEDDGENKPWPFSGPYQGISNQTLGADPDIKSAAVGSRSILTHVASGADIVVECFARSLYNYGSMAVLDQII